MGIVRGSIPGVHYPKSSSRKQRRIPAHCRRDTVPEAIIDEVLRVPGVYRPATYIARAGPENASGELIKLGGIVGRTTSLTVVRNCAPYGIRRSNLPGLRNLLRE
jgi:hypothetical protein